MYKKYSLVIGLGFALFNGSSVWAKVYEARGVGSIGKHYQLHPTQKMVMAREAALMDAQKGLLEQVKGIEVQSNSRVSNKALESEIVEKSVQGILKAYQLVSERQLGNQAYEVVLRFDDGKTKDQIKEEAVSQLAQTNSSMIQSEGPYTHDYQNNSVDISPGASYYQIRPESSFMNTPDASDSVSEVKKQETVFDVEDDMPAWLRDESKPIVHEEGFLVPGETQPRAVEKQELQDLKQMNQMKDLTIKSLDRQLSILRNKK